MPFSLALTDNYRMGGVRRANIVTIQHTKKTVTLEGFPHDADKATDVDRGGSKCVTKLKRYQQALFPFNSLAGQISHVY